MTKTVAIYGNVHSLIVKKQKHIYEKYKVNLRISDMISAILRNYTNKTEELFSLGEYKSSMPIISSGITKNVIIYDDAHKLIIDKQTEIFEKYRVNLKISDMASIISKNFIDKTEELFMLGDYVPKCRKVA